MCLHPNWALQKPAQAAFCKPLACFVSPSSTFITAHFLSKELSKDPPVPRGDNGQHSILLMHRRCLQIHKPLQPPHRTFEETLLKVHITCLIINSSHLDEGLDCFSTFSLFYYLLSCFAHNFQNGFWKIWYLHSLSTLMGTLTCDAQTGKFPW